jgi:CrcB protein
MRLAQFQSEAEMTWFLVGVGGALGSIARHGLNHLVHQRNLSATFPVGILLVNVGGSVLIGLVAGLLASGRWHWSYQARTFVIVGLLGGFTTFSSFSLDTLALARDGHPLQAFWNVVGQVGLSLLGVWFGYRMTAA